MSNLLFDNLEKVDVIKTNEVKIFSPSWIAVSFFAIAPSVKDSLVNPIGVVQKLPVSGNLEVTFKTKAGRYLDFYLDVNTKLQEGMQVHIDDLIGERLIRGEGIKNSEKCVRYLHKMDANI